MGFKYVNERCRGCYPQSIDEQLLNNLFGPYVRAVVGRERPQFSQNKKESSGLGVWAGLHLKEGYRRHQGRKTTLVCRSSWKRCLRVSLKKFVLRFQGEVAKQFTFF